RAVQLRRTARMYCNNPHPAVRPSRHARLAAPGLVLAGALALASPQTQAETRGYIISWFATATYIQNFKDSCPGGHMDGQTELNVRQLKEIGYSEEQATKIVASSGAQINDADFKRVATNARVNGKPVSIYNYPDATADPNIETVVGPNAYGFDLGGKA